MTDAIAEIDILIDPPNKRYESISLGTWNSVSDVDTFLSRFNHSTGYKDGDTKLKLGNYVTINDGTYNSQWMIAGFDIEHNQIAADGTVYDNGYGIGLIPTTQVTKAKWNESNTLVGAYKSSTMHTTHLPGIVTKLQNVLGSHIVQKNVLLSSSIDSNYYSNAYTWTTTYATLMSIGQMTGNFATNRNKYDDGEANYKLPIFDYKEYTINSYFWSRNVYGKYGDECCAFIVYPSGSFDANSNYHSYGARPLIYLR